MNCAIKVRLRNGEWVANVSVPASEMPNLELGTYVFEPGKPLDVVFDNQNWDHERFHLFLIDAARAGIAVQWTPVARKSYQQDRLEMGLDRDGAMSQAALIAFYLKRAA